METHKLPWRCWGLALGSSKDPSNGVQGEKRWPRAPLCNSALVRLTKLRPEKSKLILVSNRGLRVTFFSPWAEGGGSGGSSWPSHTFFKLPERSAVIVSGYNPRWSLVHSPTYGWGRPSQCTQGGWLAPAPISSHSKTLHLSPGRFHAALPSSQRSFLQRGPQLQSPQLSLLQEQVHLWLQGQHSGGPEQFWGVKVCSWENPKVSVWVLSCETVPSETYVVRGSMKNCTAMKYWPSLGLWQICVVPELFDIDLTTTLLSWD